MEHKYFYSVVSEFIDNTKLSKDEKYGLDVFFDFCIKRHSFLFVDSVSENIINEFLFIWLPINIKEINNHSIIDIIKGIDKLSLYVKDNYNIDISCKNNDIKDDLERLCNINKELNSFLNNPVVSYSPLIIDIERYKKYKSKRNYDDVKDKGYFMIIDFLTNNAVILKKLYVNKFIKIVLNEKLVKVVKPNDILYMSIRQNMFFSWEIENVIKYYPHQASKYIIK